MISHQIQDAFNDQLNAELYSAYLYLSMSAYFESLNLKGCANWMRCQTQEEMVHVMKFYSFINDRGGRVVPVGHRGALLSNGIRLSVHLRTRIGMSKR